MNPTLEMLKQLRTETGAGVMECRAALEQGDNDYPAALAILRAKAAAKAERRVHRDALQGYIEHYSHAGGRIGVMVQVNTETEFASRSAALRAFAREVALQVAAAAPLFVQDADIPQPVLAEQAQAAAEKARRAGKPEHIIERIVTGAVEKFKDRHVLLRQPSIRDDHLTVGQMLSQVIGQVGENVVVRRFVRWETNPESEGNA